MSAEDNSAAQPRLPRLVSTFETGKHYKVHRRSFIWFRPLFTAITLFAVIFLYNLRESLEFFDFLSSLPYLGDLSAKILAIMGGLILIYVLTIAFSALEYRFISFVFEEGEFCYYSGILRKDRIHLPYNRVQSINQSANLMQRLVGVCTADLQTAGGKVNRKVKIPYISLGTAERIRAELMSRKAAMQLDDQSLLNYVAAYDLPTDRTVKDVKAQAVSGQLAESVEAASVVNALIDKGGTAAQAEALAAQALGGAPVAPGAAAAPVEPGVAAEPGTTSSPGAPGAPVAPQAREAVDDGKSVRERVAGSLNNESFNDFGSYVGGLRGIAAGANMNLSSKPTHEAGLSNLQLLAASISQTRILAAVAIMFSALLPFYMGIEFGEDLGLPPALEELVRAVPFFSKGFSVFMVFVILLGVAVHVVINMASMGGFKVRRVEDRIEIEHGLVSRYFSGISLDRIQDIAIQQNMITRLLGYCEVSLGKISNAEDEISSKNGAGNKSGMVLHPFIRLSEAHGLVDALLPEFAGCVRKEGLHTLPRVAHRRAYLRYGIWYNYWLYIGIAAAVGEYMLQTLVPEAALLMDFEIMMLYQAAVVFCYAAVAVCILGTITQLIHAHFWVRQSGYLMKPDGVTIYNGGWRTRMHYLPRQKVQCGTTRSNPFQRRLHLTQIKVQSASTRQPSLMDVTEDEGKAWLEWITPRRQQNVEAAF